MLVSFHACLEDTCLVLQTRLSSKYVGTVKCFLFYEIYIATLKEICTNSKHVLNVPFVWTELFDKVHGSSTSGQL
jgi:hypothetical protein